MSRAPRLSGTGRGAYDVEMRQLGLEPGVELVQLGPVTPPPEIAERLGLPAGEKALIRRRHMYAGGQPMQLATSYVPWSFAEGTQMVERDSGPGGIYSRLAEVGHGPVRFTEEVATRMPTPEEARFLRLTDPQPVFKGRSCREDRRQPPQGLGTGWRSTARVLVDT